MILTHMPVPYAPNQVFGSNATAGVVGDWNGTVVQQLVAQFGNYQPVGHLAVDFPCPEGTPIVAAAPGTVVYAGPGQHMPAHIAAKYGYIYGPGGDASGNITIIDHGDGSATAYSHQKAVEVGAGQWVNGGQQIGLSGKTGRITGAHLHFEYMTLPVNYQSPYYSRSDPMAQYGAASIMPAGTITQEEDLNADQNNALADVWKRTQRNSQILEALDVNVNNQQTGVIAGLTAAVKALASAQGSQDVEKAVRDAVDAAAPTYYVKSESDATVYALDVASGKLRPVTLNEWNVVNAAGITLRVVPQKFIDAAPKATAVQAHPAP